MENEEKDLSATVRNEKTKETILKNLEEKKILKG